MKFPLISFIALSLSHLRGKRNFRRARAQPIFRGYLMDADPAIQYQKNA